MHQHVAAPVFSSAPVSRLRLAERLQRGLWTLTGLYLLAGVVWLLLGNRMLTWPARPSPSAGPMPASC